MSKNKSNIDFIPQENRYKILLMSDDLRFPSGIGNVSRDLVSSTAKHFNWVQLGGAGKHSDAGKIIDCSQSLNEELNITDSYCKIYCTNGYGDANTLREIIALEKPDAIIHFTDPRYWEWLYLIEDEIRKEVPLMYSNIWDDLPDPQYNASFYASCDLLFSISKQTYGINKRVLDRHQHPNITEKELLTLDKTNKKLNGSTVLSYLPHGVNQEMFKPLNPGDDVKFDTFAEQYKDKFVIFWNNRNMQRKQLPSTLLGIKYFKDNVERVLGKEKSDKIKVILQTTPVDGNGTDIPTLCKSLLPDVDVEFSPNGISSEEVNYLLNIADVTVNICSNEGFGLGTAESLMAGTPIIVNLTGGLQDQIGLINNKTNEYYTAEDYIDFKSAHVVENIKELTHGEWAFIVENSRSLQGAPQTPYIFDDRADFEELGLKLVQIYSLSRKERKELGLAGREFLLDEKTLLCLTSMGKKFIEVTTAFMKTWTPKKPHRFIKNIQNKNVNVFDTVKITNKYKHLIDDILSHNKN